MKRPLSRVRAFSVMGLVLLSLLALVVIQMRNNQPVNPPIAVGQVAPGFTLPDGNGQTFSLSAYKGQTVALSFGTTWCKACVEQDAHLSAIASKWQGKGVQILKIDYRETPLVVKHYTQKSDVKFPFLIDRDGQLTTDLYHVVPFPTTIIINPQGIVAKVIQKELSPSQFEQEIEQAIQKSSGKEGDKNHV